MSNSMQQTVEERPEDNDYDRASIMMAQDDFYDYLEETHR